MFPGKCDQRRMDHILLILSFYFNIFRSLAPFPLSIFIECLAEMINELL